jgi:transcriptional regulator NrdR family protein
MRCPFCGSEDSQVKDSRPSGENAAIRRRRIRSDSGGRFERVQLRELAADTREHLDIGKRCGVELDDAASQKKH